MEASDMTAPESPTIDDSGSDVSGSDVSDSDVSGADASVVDTPVFDVVVVGSGCGLIGAYAAATRGLRTLVVEKTEFVGGTTAYSGAGIWLPGNPAEARAGIEDSPDLARPYLDAIIGDDAPVSLREAYLQFGGPMIEELERNERFGRFVWLGVPDYFDGVPGSFAHGRTIFPRAMRRSALGELEPLLRPPVWSERYDVDPGEWLNGGQSLIGRALVAFTECADATLWTNAPMRRLLVEENRVVGVVVERDGLDIEVRALRGVLLAAGGFERSGELRRRYQPPLDDEWSMGAPGNTGDALLAGVEAGAATALLDEAWFTPAIMVPGNRPAFHTAVRTGIFVNGAGERFMNECLPYDRAGHEMYRLHTTTGVSHLPAHWVFDQQQIDFQAFGILPVDPVVAEWFDPEQWLAAGALVRAGTLESLADQLGVPATSLVAAIERYNGFCAAGIDDDYHRGEAPWDRSIVTRTSLDPAMPGYIGPIPTPSDNPLLVPLDQPPYYAVRVALSDLGTKGGLQTDDRARVLRPDGSVIAGLYASGNTMAPATGRIYPGAGGPIGSAMVFSYLAALDMAAPLG